MSVTIIVETTLVSSLNSTAARRGKLILGTFNLHVDIEELDERAAPILLSVDRADRIWRLHEESGWLLRIGPCPDKDEVYPWFFPSLRQLPGEFTISTLYNYVPKDRRKALTRVWDRAILESPGKVLERMLGTYDDEIVQRQLEDHRDYGDSFKIVDMFRVSAEPILRMRDDGFIHSNHGTKGWWRETSKPWELYSCAETDQLMNMSRAVDPKGVHRTSFENITIGSPERFTSSFVEERMGLLCKWMRHGVVRYRNILDTRARARFDTALSARLEGGWAEDEQAQAAVSQGTVDASVLDVAEKLLDACSSEPLTDVMAATDNGAAILAVLKEQWEGRAIDIDSVFDAATKET